MPAKSERRGQILDAAVDLLAEGGIGELTHRQVDRRARVPVGTTSNHFRTRLALLEGTAAYVVDLNWQYIEVACTTLDRPLTRAGVVALLTRMISEPDAQYRRQVLARLELFLEGSRRPEIQPFLDELWAAAVKSAGLILESAGFTPSPQQLDELTRLLDGLAFTSLTTSRDRPDAYDPAALIDRLLTTILG
jgi:DNA-binding transcriptional regulator YbjK